MILYNFLATLIYLITDRAWYERIRNIVRQRGIAENHAGEAPNQPVEVMGFFTQTLAKWGQRTAGKMNTWKNILENLQSSWRFLNGPPPSPLWHPLFNYFHTSNISFHIFDVWNFAFIVRSSWISQRNPSSLLFKLANKSLQFPFESIIPWFT